MMQVERPPNRAHAHPQALPPRFPHPLRAQPLEGRAVHGLPALLLSRPAAGDRAPARVSVQPEFGGGCAAEARVRPLPGARVGAPADGRGRHPRGAARRPPPWELEAWRNNCRGVRTTHAGTNLELFGAIDDLWRDLDSGELMVVDYKATSKSTEVTLDAPWQDGYRLRGADGVLPVAHQWLLRRRGLAVARRGWVGYCNARRDLEAFDARLG